MIRDITEKDAQMITGGKKSQWPSTPEGQILPPGLETVITDSSRIPKGLLGGDVAEYGNKNGFLVGPNGVVPRGWNA